MNAGSRPSFHWEVKASMKLAAGQRGHSEIGSKELEIQIKLEILLYYFASMSIHSILCT